MCALQKLWKHVYFQSWHVSFMLYLFTSAMKANREFSLSDIRDFSHKILVSRRFPYVVNHWNMS